MMHRAGCTICCGILLASCVPAQDAKAVFYRVDANVYRGRQPDRDDIPKLAAAGIKTVLDLRGFAHKDWEKGAVEAAGMRYVRVGLSGFFAPSSSQIDHVLAILEDPKGAPIFVHCRRGADRSGVVVACYRIVHDHWTNEEAMKEAREQGFSGFEVLMERYIRHFRASAASKPR